MKTLSIILGIQLVCLTTILEGQEPQDFFLNVWQPKSIASPGFIDVQQTTDRVTVSVKIYFSDTLTKIPRYIFGDNANVYTGCIFLVFAADRLSKK